MITVLLLVGAHWYDRRCDVEAYSCAGNIMVRALVIQRRCRKGVCMQVPNLVDFGGVDIELFFATEILKLRSLHYGYWDEIPALQDITIESIRQAQARFTERLLSHVPEGVESILDVGSGIGDNARALSARGYQVTAVSPDKNHAKYYASSPQIKFHNTTFEGFESDQRFDLIFVSEALDYFDRELGLKKFRRYLKPGGRVLIATMFRHKDKEFEDNFQLKDLPYVQLAEKHNFSLQKSVDITSNAVPTMMFAHWALLEYVQPSIEMGRIYLSASSPWKYWLFKLLLGKQIKEISRILSYYERRINPEYFKKNVRYVTLLFSMQPEA
jgi:SAM-dependent methyltransferase